nr:ubiquitin-conjugating enzyme E2 7-like [Ipomoea batatas]GMC63733.1 ubiquitin-conjugating enzyme E2 7-like [Ipomoea batatas]
MASSSLSQAILLLQKQLKDLCKNPVDGFSAGLVDENNLFEWSVTIIGPPDTLYEGGFFNAIMSFPQNYPNSPPTVRFTSEIWHPNGLCPISENVVFVVSHVIAGISFGSVV